MDGAVRGRGRPRKNEVDSARAIMVSGVRVFADKGFDATNLREIAAGAGVNMALISYQFGSKLELWKKIICEIGTKIEAALGSLDQGMDRSDPEASLRRAMETFIDFTSARPDVARFILRDVGHASDRAQWIYEKVTRRLLDHFMPLIEQARADGCLRTNYPELVFLQFAYGAAVCIVRRRLVVHLLPQVSDDEQFRAALYETLIEPVFRRG